MAMGACIKVGLGKTGSTEGQGGERVSVNRSLSHLLPSSQGTIREEAKAGTGCKLGIIQAPEEAKGEEEKAGGRGGSGGPSWERRALS